jgi:hypothetical protein
MEPKYTTAEIIDLLQRHDLYLQAQEAKEAWQRMRDEANLLLASVTITPREIETANRIKDARN